MSSWHVPDGRQEATKQATAQQPPPPPASPSLVPRSPARRRWPIVGAVVAVLVVVAVVAALLVIPSTDNGSPSPTTNPPLTSNQGGPAPPGPGVTLGEFNQVTSGMPYLRVSQILRSPGSLVNDTNALGVHDQTFIWHGTTPGSNAIVGFQNDKAVTVVQVGLTG